MTLSPLAQSVIKIAEAAGQEILALSAPVITKKSDGSSVTTADLAAEALITKGLTALLDQAPIIAEEAMAGGQITSATDKFWLVDPLDGTQEFIEGRKEYCVCVALIVGNIPVLGVIHAPALGISWGVERHGLAWRRDSSHTTNPILATRVPAQPGLVAITSRNHQREEPDLSRFLQGQTISQHLHMGSALKFCALADGQADIYPRFGGTSEWDTAAGQAIVEAAGGRVQNLDGRPLVYGKPAWRNRGFIAWRRG